MRTTSVDAASTRAGAIRTGLERLRAGEGPSLSGRAVALFGGPGTTLESVAVLQGCGANVRRIFAGEFGPCGRLAPQEGVPDGDVESISFRSRYGAGDAEFAAEAHRTRPRPEELADVDLLVVDIADPGVRAFTPTWSAALVAREALRAGREVLVLDRPNLLGGGAAQVEGSPQRAGFLSLAGLESVASRHGMTTAELLRLYLERRAPAAAARLEIVPLEGWGREPAAPEVDEVPMNGRALERASLRAALASAPWVDDAWEVAATHDDGSWAGALRRVFATVRARPEGENPWRTRPFQHDNRRPAIDLLTGSPAFRSAANEGASLDALLAAEAEGAQAFVEARRHFLLY